MNHRISTAAGLLGLGLIAGSAAGAGEKIVEKHVVAVRAGDSETIETDVTDLEAGEARSFVTEDGTIIDILRGAEGVEIYVDGELVEAAGAGVETEIVQREMEIECEGDQAADCEEELLLLVAGAAALDGADGAAGTRIEIHCDGTADCEEHVWIEKDGASAEGDALAGDGRTIRVIRIHEEVAESEETQ